MVIFIYNQFQYRFVNSFYLNQFLNYFVLNLFFVNCWIVGTQRGIFETTQHK